MSSANLHIIEALFNKILSFELLLPKYLVFKHMLQIKNYSVIRQLGEGNYGQVFQIALQSPPPHIPPTLALKIINKPAPTSCTNITTTPSSAATQIIQPQILASLEHPNIIRLYHSQQTANHVELYLEYVECGDLSKIAKPVSKTEVVNWLTQMTLALHYLHRTANIIHRDMKLQNVLLSTEGLIKLADFGISRKLELDEEFTRTALGSPFFMSPEMIRGNQYDYKTDVWGLGCCLYELCTGSKPFQASSVKDLLFNIEYGTASLIDSTDYPSWLIKLCKSMLEKDPEKRPDTSEILQIPQISQEVEFLRKKYPSYEAKLRPKQINLSLESDVKEDKSLPKTTKYLERQDSSFPKFKPTDGNMKTTRHYPKCIPSIATTSPCSSPLLNPLVASLNSNKSSMSKTPIHLASTCLSSSTKSASTALVSGPNSFSKNSNNVGKVDHRFYERSLKFMVETKKKKMQQEPVSESILRQPQVRGRSRVPNEIYLSITIQQECQRS